MRKNSCWKRNARRLVYCRPKLNRKLMCVCSSFEEVSRILNTAPCSEHDHCRK